MTVRVGINGFGRMDADFSRALLGERAAGAATGRSSWSRRNDLTDNATLAHLLKFDSILGRLPFDVTLEGDDTIVVGDHKIQVAEGQGRPGHMPWGDLGVDVVVSPPASSPCR